MSLSEAADTEEVAKARTMGETRVKGKLEEALGAMARVRAWNMEQLYMASTPGVRIRLRVVALAMQMRTMTVMRMRMMRMMSRRTS